MELEQGELTIEQPSDPGNWGPSYRAPQHKILALDDNTVLQDTGEWRGHLCQVWPCEGKQHKDPLRHIAHPPGGWPVIPSLVRQTPYSLGPWASSTAGYASPTSMLGEEKHQTLAVHSVQLTGGLPGLQSSLVLGHTHRGACLRSLWHRLLPYTFDCCYPEHPGSAFSHLSVL